MGEVSRSLRIAHRASLGVVAAIMAGSLSSSADARPVSAELSTCYDNPAPLLPRTEIDPNQSPDIRNATGVDPITVRQDSGKAAEGYAGPLPQHVTNIVMGAAVKITRGDTYASGVVVRGPNGERVVVTAAHVAEQEPGETEPLIMTDINGNRATVASGCTVNGSNGETTPALDEIPDQVDIAILRPSIPLGTTALSLAPEPPKRGDLVGFYNFQQNRSIHNAANFSGIALDLRAPYSNNSVLTSLGFEDDDIYDHAMVPGGSGGMAVNFNTGELYGTSVSLSVRSHQTAKNYGVEYESFVSSSDDRTFIANITDAVDIQRAMQEGSY